MSSPHAGQYRPSGTPVPHLGQGGPPVGERRRLPQDGQNGSPLTTAPPQNGQFVRLADGRGPVEEVRSGSIVTLAVCAPPAARGTCRSATPSLPAGY